MRGTEKGARDLEFYSVYFSTYWNLGDFYFGVFCINKINQRSWVIYICCMSGLYKPICLCICFRLISCHSVLPLPNS